MRFTKASAAILALGLACAGAKANGDFVTLLRAQVDMDDTHPVLVVAFTLPDSVNVRSTLNNSPVIDFDVLGSSFFFNRAYINPPGAFCRGNDDDPNGAAAIGYLQAHQDIHMSSEWATNHITLPATMLKPGDNQFMICIRDSTGHAGPGVQNLDAISVRNVTLMFHDK